MEFSSSFPCGRLLPLLEPLLRILVATIFLNPVTPAIRPLIARSLALEALEVVLLSYTTTVTFHQSTVAILLHVLCLCVCQYLFLQVSNTILCYTRPIVTVKVWHISYI